MQKDLVLNKFSQCQSGPVLSQFDRFLLIGPAADLRIGQVGHGLGPRAFGANTQLLPMTTHYWLKVCETAQMHNFTIYFDTSENANVSRLLSA